MSDSSREAVFAILLATFRPIASMLLRFGVSYKDFDRVCRAAFVEAAASEQEVVGKSANVSRISLRTGLTRKAVRVVQTQSLSEGVSQLEIRSLPSEVLHVWHTDPRFCVQPGVARELTWDSGGNSFVDLVRRSSSTVLPSTLRDELIRVGAIEQTAGGTLNARRRSFVPVTAQDRLIQGLQYGLRPLAMTVAHNASTNNPENVRFQRIVWNYCLPKEKRGEVDKLVTRMLEEISQEIDDLLSEVESSGSGEEPSVFGVGLYHFEDDPNDVGGGGIPKVAG